MSTAAAPSNLHLAWARLFVHAVAAAGVTDAVLSPGSRSTPLAIALAGEPRLRLHVIVDERTAGFFALGQARVTGRPSLLACTSGTAGAHYLPAVIEAAQSFVPMLVVTADRPWELYDAAAPQTIDQVKLFGDFVRHHAELGLPDASPSALRAVPRIAAQAVALSLGPTPGPVHLNARFRKPLEPVATAAPEPWQPLVDALLARGAPTVLAPPASSVPDATTIAGIAERIARAERGLIVCGPAPLAQAGARDAILALARRTGFPLLAEGTSQIRFGGSRMGIVECGAFDAVLRSATFRAAHPPDLILQLGAPPTSSAYAELCSGSPGAARIVVAPHGWNDPQGDAAVLVFADPGALAEALVHQLPLSERSAWSQAFAAAGARADRVTASAAAGATLGEGAIARALLASCPADAIVAIGNSTPVRDLDVFCPPSPRPVRIAHQRGASGIDGLVSGAAGIASVSSTPTALLLGDLSLLHDVGALALLARVGTALVVVVVQNGGGRIFDQLPIARSVDADFFERCFSTPQAVHFEHAAAAFGVPYARAETAAALEAALAAAWQHRGATLIEAVAAPREGARTMARIWAELAQDP